MVFLLGNHNFPASHKINISFSCIINVYPRIEMFCFENRISFLNNFFLQCKNCPNTCRSKWNKFAQLQVWVGNKICPVENSTLLLHWLIGQIWYLGINDNDLHKRIFSQLLYFTLNFIVTTHWNCLHIRVFFSIFMLVHFERLEELGSFFLNFQIILENMPIF